MSPSLSWMLSLHCGTQFSTCIVHLAPSLSPSTAFFNHAVDMVFHESLSSTLLLNANPSVQFLRSAKILRMQEGLDMKRALWHGFVRLHLFRSIDRETPVQTRNQPRRQGLQIWPRSSGSIQCHGWFLPWLWRWWWPCIVIIMLGPWASTTETPSTRVSCSWRRSAPGSCHPARESHGVETPVSQMAGLQG